MLRVGDRTPALSLKAKIEAVIYASEEPVTLAQLTGLLSQEAQAELDQANLAQQKLALDEPATLREPATREGMGSAEDGGEARDDAESIALDERIAAREERARASRLREYFRGLLSELIADYAQAGRGLEIREVAGGYRFATKPEYHDAVRGFVRLLKPPLKLSFPALETLAVVAYKQPVTGPEVSEIRGVDSGGVLGSLMARKLVTTAGRKQVIGRPILYKTTKDFLLKFGLRDVTELPSIEEFEKMAGELTEAEPLQEEMAMTDSSESMTEANLEEERDATEPQADGDSSEVAPVDGRMSGPPPSYAATEDGDPSAAEAQVQADAPDTVGTPEGDNEFAPDQPLTPAPEGLQRVPAIDTNEV